MKYLKVLLLLKVIAQINTEMTTMIMIKIKITMINKDRMDEMGNDRNLKK